MSIAACGTQIRLAPLAHKPWFTHTAAGGCLTIAVATADNATGTWQAGICRGAEIQGKGKGAPRSDMFVLVARLPAALHMQTTHSAEICEVPVRI